jgi:hypothetical protein
VVQEVGGARFLLKSGRILLYLYSSGAQKEEKAHDDRLASSNAKIKAAGQCSDGAYLAFGLHMSIQGKLTNARPRRILVMWGKNMLNTSICLLPWVLR